MTEPPADVLPAEATRASLDRRILNAAVTVAALTVLARIASFARELAIAREFGVGGDVDAFFIAYMFPAFAVAVIAGSLNAAFVPTYLRVRAAQGAAAAQRLFSSVTTWAALLLLATAALTAVVVPLLLPLIAGDFDGATRALTQSVFLLLLPLLVLSGISTTWAAALNAHERFALAALVPAATPVLTIAGVVLLANVWGVYGIVAGAVAGAAAEVGLLALALRRHGLSPRPRWYGLTDETRVVLGQYGPMTIGSIAMASTLLIDGAMAATLGEGAVSALNYGQRVVSFVVGVTAFAVATAALPYFSQLAADGDREGLRRRLSTYVKLLLVATAPLVAAIWFASEPVVRLLFEGGEFGPADTEVVSRVQQLFALQIPFYVCGMLAVRVITALRATKILMWGAILNAAVNIVGNFVLMRWLGVEGIALSTSVVYVVSFSFLWTAARRLLRPAGASAA